LTVAALDPVTNLNILKASHEYSSLLHSHPDCRFLQEGKYGEASNHKYNRSTWEQVQDG
jgi:hypothetical protein